MIVTESDRTQVDKTTRLERVGRGLTAPLNSRPPESAEQGSKVHKPEGKIVEFKKCRI